MTPHQALAYLDNILGRVVLIAVGDQRAGLTRGDFIQIDAAVQTIAEALKGAEAPAPQDDPAEERDRNPSS